MKHLAKLMLLTLGLENSFRGKKKFPASAVTLKRREPPMRTLSIITIAAFGFLALANFASAQDWQKERFQVSSTTFENNTTLPLSMIYNYQVNGVQRLLH